MSTRFPAFASVVGALALGAVVHGDVLLADPFNGSVLDPAWTVSFAGNTAGWTFGVGGGVLAATDIAPVAFPPGCDVSGATWSEVNLDRPFAPTGDFVCDMSVSWDSAGVASAMQILSVAVLDCNGVVIGQVLLDDAWVATSGTKAALLGTQFAITGAGTLPLAGSGILRLERAGTLWTASFAGVPILSKTVLGVPRTLRVTFSYYASHLCAGGNTLFGTESIDWIQIDGEGGPQQAGDLNGDGLINGADIAIVLGAWGTASCIADADQSGVVDGADIAVVLGDWTG